MWSTRLQQRLMRPRGKPNLYSAVKETSPLFKTPARPAHAQAGARKNRLACTRDGR
jgi:hypothetical protein